MSKWNVLRYYLRFKYGKFATKEKLIKYQNRKIQKRLSFVSKNSGFYKEYEGKELKDFPVIDKKIMMENFNHINTVRIEKEEALAFAIGSEREREFSEKLHNITVGLSSGTSDSRGIFLVENSEKDKWAGYVLAKFLPKGILSKCKIAFFMRANSNLYEAVGSKNIGFEFFDIYADIEENIEKLQKFQADILVAQPSVLLTIANAIKNKTLKISPKRVISIAEVLEKEDEAYLKKVFQMEIIDQVYQCTEGCLASTCSCGTLHLNEDIVYIEKEYLDDKRFVPIITDLERTSQPIIRYRLNDVLVEKKEKCPCGLIFTSLEKIEGREDDVFQFQKENGKSVCIYPDFIRRCILFAGSITDYRIVQQENGSITVFADIDKNMKEKVYEEFQKLASDREFILPDIQFENYYYDKKRKLKRVERCVNRRVTNEEVKDFGKR